MVACVDKADDLVGGRVAGWERLFRRFVDTGVSFGPKNLLFGLELDIEFVSASVDSFCECKPVDGGLLRMQAWRSPPAITVA
jgi:hypothetical protein